MDKDKFDPFNHGLTAEELLKLDSECGKAIQDPTRPIYQVSAAERVSSLKDGALSGDGFDVLSAISWCATHQLVMPEWLSQEYLNRYREVLNCRLGSWDDAFGKPYPGKHLNSLKKKRNLRFAVVNRVNEIKREEPRTPTDKSLFSRVGKELNLGATHTEELYYSGRNYFGVNKATGSSE